MTLEWKILRRKFKLKLTSSGISIKLKLKCWNHLKTKNKKKKSHKGKEEKVIDLVEDYTDNNNETDVDSTASSVELNPIPVNTVALIQNLKVILNNMLWTLIMN